MYLQPQQQQHLLKNLLSNNNNNNNNANMNNTKNTDENQNYTLDYSNNNNNKNNHIESIDMAQRNSQLEIMSSSSNNQTQVVTNNDSNYLWSEYEKAIAAAISMNIRNNLNSIDVSTLNPLTLALLISLTNGEAYKLFQSNIGQFVYNNNFHSHDMTNRPSVSNRESNSLQNNNNNPQNINLQNRQVATELANINHNHLQIDDNISLNSIQSHNSFKSQAPSVPSSTLLAKLTSLSGRKNSNNIATKLDNGMVELLEAFYSINHFPDSVAIEMIARRLNASQEIILDWFERKSEFSQQDGPRSPPSKKRPGGRVVTFSEYQRSLLEAIFNENNYLHPQEYEELSNLIQVPSRNIKIWFKNRRSKQRLSGRIIVH